ncbi:MAG: hypothetical protein F4007_09465 [Chloroflexi bacterium]|nr:hypothetical protein [Chloroflexota bacterium]
MALNQAGQERNVAQVDGFVRRSVGRGENIEDPAVGDADGMVRQPVVHRRIRDARSSIEAPLGLRHQ